MNGRMEAEQMAAEHEAKQPVAWAIVGPDGTVLDSHIYHTESLARRWAVQNGDKVLPLYRSPTLTLTDAEREAVEWVTNHYQRVCDEYGPSSYDIQLISTIRGLLARCATSTTSGDGP